METLKKKREKITWKKKEKKRQCLFVVCCALLGIYKSAGLQVKYVKLTSIDITCVIFSPNPIFDHLLESSHRDDSNKWSNIGFGEEIGIKMGN